MSTRMSPADWAMAQRVKNYRPTAEGTAHHEAGHVMACFVTLVPFATATIEPAVVLGRKMQGHVGYGPTFGRSDPWIQAMISHAGWLAARPVVGRDAVIGGRGDLEAIAALHRPWVADRSPGTPRRAAEDMVREHRGHISALADLLLAERTLDPRQILTALPQLVPLLESVRPPQPSRKD